MHFINYRTMPFYILLLSNPNTRRGITGLTSKQFDVLLTQFIRHLPSKSTGRPHTLFSPELKLSFILFFCRYYLPQWFLALICGVHQSQISRWVSELMDILDSAAATYISRAQMNAYFKSRHVYLVDATERAVQRIEAKQKKLYSGKKKRHTIKNQIVVDLFNKLIVHVSPTVVGSVHDFKLFKGTYQELLSICKPRSRILADSGYQGMDDLVDDTYKVSLPNKASKNYPLTEAERSQNALLSSKRVRVEHVIGSIKRYQILHQQFRGSSELADRTFRSIAGLHNLQTMYR